MYTSTSWTDYETYGYLLVNDNDKGNDWVFSINATISVTDHRVALSDPVFANGFFYVLDFGTKACLRSVDGKSWDVLSAPGCLFDTFVLASELMVANDQVFTSCLNGTLEVLVDEIWEVTSLNSGLPVLSINYLSEDSLYVASANSIIWYSKNGMDWNEGSSLPTEGIFSTEYTEVVYSDGTYVAFNYADIWVGQ